MHVKGLPLLYMYMYMYVNNHLYMYLYCIEFSAISTFHLNHTLEVSFYYIEAYGIIWLFTCNLFSVSRFKVYGYILHLKYFICSFSVHIVLFHFILLYFILLRVCMCYLCRAIAVTATVIC